MSLIEDDYVKVKSKVGCFWLWLQLIVCGIFLVICVFFLWGFFMVVTE